MQDDESYLSGTEFGFNYARIASQMRDAARAASPMVFGVYDPGHLRHSMHYVNNGIVTPGSMWAFYLIGDCGLTATVPIATKGMKPSLITLYQYLTMIEEATVGHPW